MKKNELIKIAVENLSTPKRYMHATFLALCPIAQRYKFLYCFNKKKNRKDFSIIKYIKWLYSSDAICQLEYFLVQ